MGISLLFKTKTLRKSVKIQLASQTGFRGSIEENNVKAWTQTFCIRKTKKES